MSVILTKERKIGRGEDGLPVNFVCAYEPLPEDAFVKTYLNGPDGRYLLSTQTIDRYQAVVDWAVRMAGQMAWPIDIVPITAVQFMRENRQRIENGLSTMTDQERGKLRRLIVQGMIEVMRDCDDHAVRSDAYDLLAKMRVVQ